MQNTKFVLLLSYRSVSGGFSLVDYSPCPLICRCKIVMFLDFSGCFLISFSLRPGQVFWKPCLIALRRRAVVGMKSAALTYCDIYGFKFLGHNVISHSFLLLCFQGHLPHSSFLVPGFFDYFLSIFMD